MTHTYQIKGMTCNGCVAKVRSELLKLGDVLSAEVQLAHPQATITMQQHIPLAKLQAAVSQAGAYTITEDVEGAQHMEHKEAASNAETSSPGYFPLYLIFGYITGITLLIQIVNGGFNLMQWMSHFMAGFFLVFSFFKLMKLNAFAEGYRTYDLIARRFPAYAYVYPFIELGLGLAFVTGVAPLAVNIITLVVMGVSSLGVVQSLLRKTQFQCACLGTVIQLPLSKVTLFEDLLMTGMSAVMIIIFIFT